MDRLPGHQLEESRDTSAITSIPFFEQGLEPLRRGQYTEIDSLIRLAKELDMSGLRKQGNVLYALIQECVQYQLLQQELSETIAHSTRLYTEMQAKIDSIISLCRALLMEHYSTNHALAEEQVQHTATASAIPALDELLAEKSIASSAAVVKEDSLLTFSATCLLMAGRRGGCIIAQTAGDHEHSATFAH